MQLPDVQEIKKHFPFHRICVLKNLLLLVQCIIISRTICLNKLKAKAAIATSNKTINQENVYARFIRFFGMKCIDVFCICIGLLIMTLVCTETCSYLTLDRTNWKIGTKNVNILSIGVILPCNIYIPIICTILDKRGNSNQKERITLLNKLLKFWPKPDFKVTILADREFIGMDWIDTLIDKSISFIVRLRKNTYINNLASDFEKTPEKMLRYIKRKVNQNGFFISELCVNGTKCYFIAVLDTTKSKEKYTYFISDIESVKEIIDTYNKRWTIEIFFKNVKTNGFNLEDLNMTDPDKIQLAACVVGFAYVLAIVEGIEQVKYKPIPMKSYKNRDKTEFVDYMAVSLFTVGYNMLQIKVHTVLDLLDYILKSILIDVDLNFSKLKHYLNPRKKSV